MLKRSTNQCVYNTTSSTSRIEIIIVIVQIHNEAFDSDYSTFEDIKPSSLSSKGLFLIMPQFFYHKI